MGDWQNFVKFFWNLDGEEAWNRAEKTDNWLIEARSRVEEVVQKKKELASFCWCKVELANRQSIILPSIKEIKYNRFGIMAKIKIELVNNFEFYMFLTLFV